MKKVPLLILDDEPEVLNALKRILRTEFELFLFSDPIEALEFYRDHPIALVLSDMRMPIMDGATFLTMVAKINPRSKRFLLTGHSDLDLTVTAVNDGKISHYFTKPWDNQQLITQLRLASQSYSEQVKSLRLFKVNHDKNAELSQLNASMEADADKQQKYILRMKKNFNVFIEIYADSIAMHTQERSGHNYRVGAQARYLALQLGCNIIEAYQTYVAGLLYETGKLALPQSLLEQAFDQLNMQQQTNFNQFFQQTVTMLSTVNQLSGVVEIIKFIPEHFNDLKAAENLPHSDTPLGSRILAVVIAFDNFILGRQTMAKMSVVKAKQLIEQQANKDLDPVVIEVFFKMLQTLPVTDDEQLEFAVDLSQVTTGWLLAKDLENSHQDILLTRGTVLTQCHIEQLTKLSNEKQPLILFVRAPSGMERSNNIV